jgi:hypothetical protein
LEAILDKILVEDLPAILLMIEPLGAELAAMVDPICNAARQAADGCSGQGGER